MGLPASGCTTTYSVAWHATRFYLGLHRVRYMHSCGTYRVLTVRGHSGLLDGNTVDSLRPRPPTLPADADAPLSCSEPLSDQLQRRMCCGCVWLVCLLESGSHYRRRFDVCG